MKKRLSVILIITLISTILNIKECYALDTLTGINSVYNALNNAQTTQEKSNAIRDWIGKNSESAGFIYDFVSVQPPASTLISLLPSSVVSGLGSDPTDEQVYDATINFIQNNQTVSDNSVTNNTDINTFIKNFHDDTVKNNLVYCYSYGLYTISDGYVLPKNTSVFRSVAQLESALTLMSGNNNTNYAINNYDKNYVWWLNNPSNGYQYLYKFSLIEHPYLVFKNATGGANPTGDKTAVMVVNSYDNTLLQPADECYRWNGTSGEWELQESASYNNGTVRNIGLKNDPKKDSNDYSIILNYFSREYRWFSYSSALSPQDVMTQPYYYNHDVWQDFSSTTGDYVVTDENINTVSYGDVVNYINSFNTENGYPPTASEININIEKEDDENKNPSGGGGSGSGSDSGSGDDSSGSDAGSSILGQLGKVIGDLLKGIIAFITGILEGIVEGLTSLLESLTTLISDFVEAIPNVISPLIGWVFDGLPSEIQALIILGIGLGITISIIKIIRG